MVFHHRRPESDGHGFGSLIRGTGGAKYSFLHNLYAHNRGRNPRPGNYDSNPHDKDPLGLLLDFRNNVVYNWGGEHAAYNADKVSVTRLNFVNNYFIPGQDSKASGIVYSTGSAYNRAYFAGNYYMDTLPEDQWKLVKFNKSWTEDQIASYKQKQAFEAGLVQTQEASVAYNKVLETGGAVLPKRDPADQTHSKRCSSAYRPDYSKPGRSGRLARIKKHRSSLGYRFGWYAR